MAETRIPVYQCDQCGGLATQAQMLDDQTFDEELGADIFTPFECPHCQAFHFTLADGWTRQANGAGAEIRGAR